MGGLLSVMAAGYSFDGGTLLNAVTGDGALGSAHGVQRSVPAGFFGWAAQQEVGSGKEKRNALTGVAAGSASRGAISCSLGGQATPHNAAQACVEGGDGFSRFLLHLMQRVSVIAAACANARRRKVIIGRYPGKRGLPERAVPYITP
ncbi:hypothetical protein NDU88_011172 [Pleurodeles waltl]|uniref:Uncharacterized protein n=1 Tax=Pleurodeles waltl TaxID=8319 RepID=A0AAV7PXP7_PLEWA|nr:hypothetical protein NDU88_011172 [Pleurodeles waltl]